MDRADAYDVITDPELNSRTASLKRQFSLLLAAQAAYDSWYSKSPEELVAKVKEGFDPSKVILNKLLEYSSSVDSEMLRVLRDVGVGSPQIGVPGIGVPLPGPQSPPGPATQPSKRGVFRG